MWMHLGLLALMALMLCSAHPAAADSWMPAERKTYLSPHRTARLTVQPRVVRSPLAYFDAKLEERALPGQPPKALIERLDHGRWVRVRDLALVNDVAPVLMLVSDDAAHVITFDNWHSMSWGKDTVVLYGADGKVVRAYALTDILPEDYVRALPRSVSSLWWSGEHRLAGDRALLRVAVPGDRALDVKRDCIDVAIDLVTGTVTLPTGAKWDRAMAAARPIALRDRAAEANARAFQLASRAAPTSADREAWMHYLVQIAPRLAPAGSGDFVASWVLPAPGDSEYAQTAKDIANVIAGWDGKVVAFASPAAPDALAQLLTKEAAGVPREALANVHVLVALSERLHPAVRDALAPLGARVVIFDPAIPVPQRTDVIHALGVGPDQVDAEAARARAQARAYEEQAVQLDRLAQPQAKKAKDSRMKSKADEIADDLERAADLLDREGQAKDTD